MKKYIQLLLFLFLAFTIFLSLNRHSKAGIQTYHSEIWADKAGYYVYLPFYFIYGLDASTLPADIDKLTGNGFKFKEGKMITKYSYGVALMQSPLFLIAHLYSKSIGVSDGFSLPYHKAIDIAAVLYSFLALLLLYKVLLQFVNSQTAFLSIVFLYLGTNLFYYSIFETGMSHIYSFFLFTCMLYLAPRWQHKRTIDFVLTGLVVGGILAVRPMNIIFFPSLLIIYPSCINQIKEQFPKFILSGVIAFIVFIPQMIYWQYAFGDFLHYSYEGESFSNLSSPKWLQLLFSTNNSLFIYSPMVAVLIFSVVMRISINRIQSIGLILYFIFITYIFSSWHDWTYGCSFGCRPYIEYYTLFSIPFAIVLSQQKQPIKYFLLATLILCSAYTLKLEFTYDGCWYGADWDYNNWFKLLIGPTK